MGAKLLGSEIRDKEKKEEPPRAGTIYQMIEIVDKCRAEVMYMKGKINAISRENKRTFVTWRSDVYNQNHKSILA